MSREANSLMPETGLWPARPAGRPRGGPSAPAITKPGSDSPTCPPAALRSRRAPGHRARGGGQLKRKVPGTPGSRCGAARPPVPERSTVSGRAAAGALRGLPARAQHSPSATAAAAASRPSRSRRSSQGGRRRSLEARRVPRGRRHRAPRTPRDAAPPPGRAIGRRRRLRGPPLARGRGPGRGARVT